jgi:hypothetical protein
MLPARGLGLKRRTADSAPRTRRRASNVPPRAPPWHPPQALASAADRPGAPPSPSPSPPPSSLAALLAPLLAPHVARPQSQAKSKRRLAVPAAVFWDADNVRPSGEARVAAVRRRLADLVRQLRDAGCLVLSASAYANEATLGESGRAEEEDDDDAAAPDDGCPRPRLVITNAGKRQSADMALLSDLVAFVSQQQQKQQQQQQQQQEQPDAASPTTTTALAPSCLVLLVADDAGYAGACAWASAPPRSALVVACGASAGRRARYAPPGAPADPSRFHPLARVVAAVVVPWAVADGALGEEGGGPDASAAWINPEGLLGEARGRPSTTEETKQPE